MRRLLVVDDDESNRLTLSALLEDEGYLVDVAASFSEAKQLLEESPPHYEALLLDHSLGDGFGMDLVPLIRQILPGSKVIAMSGSIGADRMRHEADAELAKGMHFPEFLRRLRLILGHG
jgi:two-component system, response regulator RegA